MNGRLLLLCLVALCACGEGEGAVLVPPRDDTGRTAADASVASDLDGGGEDAGSDAGSPDSGRPDAGPPDSGTTDGGPRDAGAPDSGTPDAGPPDSGTTDAGPPDAGAPDAGRLPPPASVLPVTYTRADVGTPVSQAELDTATDELIALVRGTRYFDVIDERVHGWPQSSGGFWWGSWWSGVTVTKTSGHVTYTHSSDGADNNGLRTAPLLEGACYARLLWSTDLSTDLVRRIARAFSGDALAMKRSGTDTASTMLSRTHYTPNVTSLDHGRAITIDMSANRPGINGTSTYVHLPTNPTFGDIWVKNTRSKDDMGHVFRAIVQAQACVGRLPPDAQADLAQTVSLYAAWARQVEADGWAIATLDPSAQVTVPPITETLAHYILTGDLECPAALMLRLFGGGTPNGLNCQNGISALELLSGTSLNNSAKQIVRTHHEAAVNVAWLTGQTSIGTTLLGGLATRVTTDLAAVNGGAASVNPNDIAAELIHSANAGLPLTSEEVRWLHGRLHLAAQSYLAVSPTTYDVFDAGTPDGTYPFEPAGNGVAFTELGAWLGACAAPYRNPATRPLFNCAKLAAAF